MYCTTPTSVDTVLCSTTVSDSIVCLSPFELQQRAASRCLSRLFPMTRASHHVNAILDRCGAWPFRSSACRRGGQPTSALGSPKEEPAAPQGSVVVVARWDRRAIVRRVLRLRPSSSADPHAIPLFTSTQPHRSAAGGPPVGLDSAAVVSPLSIPPIVTHGRKS